MKYLKIDYKYKTISGQDSQVTFFIPKSFIESGDLEQWSLLPENFLGVNLKKLWDQINHDAIL